jgi:hypothetical protein
VSAYSDGDADAALDALVAHCVTALLADPRWEKRVIDVRESGTQWDAEARETVVAAAAVDFLIDYVTPADRP